MRCAVVLSYYLWACGVAWGVVEWVCGDGGVSRLISVVECVVWCCKAVWSCDICLSHFCLKQHSGGVVSFCQGGVV